MDNQKKQVVDKLKAAKNVLVTVSNDPSIDQLAACLGLTLMLNKLGKHASAVFSGEVPSVIDFLKPEETLETDTNSLRDFIIALDKSKADKLRYKVEDKVVRIFITPYKTSISQDDLEFSEGDFNVDVVMALGVREQQDIDQAVTAHGNILHDATVITVTTSEESQLGSLHWRDPAASGVSELAASLSDSFDKNVLDEQIATAFLTGIVAQTARFSNNLTASSTMSVSAKLMSAGANQQLVATELETPPEPEITAAEEAPKDDNPEVAGPEARTDGNDGALEIDHSAVDGDGDQLVEEDNGDRPHLSDILRQSKSYGEPLEQTDAEEDREAPSGGEAATDEDNPINHLNEPEGALTSRGTILEGKGPDNGQLTANSEEEKLEPSTDALNLPPMDQPILSHDGASESLKSKFSKKAARIFQPPRHESAKIDKTEQQPEPTSLSSSQSDSPAEDKSSGINYEPLSSEPDIKVEDEAASQPLNNDFSDPNKPQTLDDIESSVHSPHQAKADTAAPVASLPAVPSTDIADRLPSVSVDQNGQLIHHGFDEPSGSEGFQPAPGFGSTDSAMNMPAPSLKPLQDQSSETEPDNNPPPPNPPPIV